jgi:membrane-bound lytic murein transglycosylase A
MFARLDRAVALLAASLLLAASGCKHAQPAPPAMKWDGELPPGQIALRKIPIEQYPDFSNSTWNLQGLGPAIDHSIDYMNHPSSRASFPYLDITHDRAMATLKAFHELIDKAANRADAGAFINSEIRNNFEVYKSVGAPKPEGSGFTDRVMFTGYFTPIYDASTKREGPYQWPIYKKPKDLKLDPVTGETAAPYFNREEIEQQGKLARLELAYLKTRWEAYVITIQGSAKLKLANGTTLEIGYAGNNGYEYTSPGLQMLQDGVITKDQLNVKSLGAYFAAHPDIADKYLWMNKRTVFFTDRPGGPFGALNVPVTKWCTIATDKTRDKVVNMTIYPRAMPAFLNVPVPRTDEPAQTWQFQGFMMDQDTGGAIRAAGRSDIYMGIGPEAESLAGRQMNDGELYYIAVKENLVPQYLNLPIGPMPTTRPVRR